MRMLGCPKPYVREIFYRGFATEVICSTVFELKITAAIHNFLTTTIKNYFIKSCFLPAAIFSITYYCPYSILELSDEQFIKKFRLSKELAGEIIEVLTPYMTERTRKTSISIERKL